MSNEVRRRRWRSGLVAGVLAAALASLAATGARADELLTETFTGASVTDPSFTVGGINFRSCLTASQSTSQSPVPGCAVGAVALPTGGDPAGSGALRLTDNGTGRAGYVLYNRPLPLTAGVQVDFDFFAYRGNAPNGADGLAFFLADGNVNLTQPGGYGGALGYASNRASNQPGLAGGYIGLGLDEYGNYSNAATQGIGCPANPAVGFRPQSVALRGPGSGLNGYCLLGTTPVAALGGISRRTALVRTETGVRRSARLMVDPLGQPGAQLTVFLDFHDGNGLQQVFQAPLPPNPPSTFKFGFAGATGGSVNIHEIRFLRVSSIQALPRLTLAKTHTGGVVAGTVEDFELQATISGAPGDGPEQAPVTVSDLLPPGDTVAATPSGTGWDCSATVVGSGTASCTYDASVASPLAPGAVLPPITVPVRIAPDHAGTYVNTATAASSDNTNTPAESSAADTYTVSRLAGLALTKTAAPSPVAVGEAVTYTLTARNAGPSLATEVMVADPLPAGMAFVSASPACTPAAGTVRCSVAALAPGGSAEFRIVTRPDASIAGQTVTNIATVSADEPDPDPDDNRAAATVVVGDLADLRLAKTASPASVVPGEETAFTLVMSNDGPTAAVDARVSDTLPAGLTFVSASAGCGEAGGTVTCTAGALASGASRTYTVTARAASSLAECPRNTAEATSDTPDPDMGNNSASVCPPLRGRVDLSIAKDPSRTVLPAGGGQVMYTLVVRNRGPSDGTGITVTDPMPAGLSLLSAEPSQGSCSTAAGDVRCDLGGLAAGGSAQVLVTTQAWATPGAITNRAEVSGSREETDASDNRAAATVTVLSPSAPRPLPPLPPAAFDLAVDKRANVARPTVGQRVAYRIVVTNRGLAAAPDVNVTDTLSARGAVVSARTTAGSCARRIPLRCALGTLPAGRSATITVVLRHRQPGCRQRNAASATGAGADGDPADNLSAVSVCVRRVALRLAKTAGRSTVRAGQTLAYRISVRNRTRGEARDVQVCDRLPAGLAFAGSQPRAKLAGGRRCWAIRRLGAREQRTFRITARALNGARGRTTNRVTATSDDVLSARARRTVRVEPGRVRRGGVTG